MLFNRRIQYEVGRKGLSHTSLLRLAPNLSLHGPNIQLPQVGLQGGGGVGIQGCPADFPHGSMPMIFNPILCPAWQHLQGLPNLTVLPLIFCQRSCSLNTGKSVAGAENVKLASLLEVLLEIILYLLPRKSPLSPFSPRPLLKLIH